MRVQLAVMSAISMVVIAGPRMARADAPPTQIEIAALQTAYTDLKIGNHDYKGHRIKALHQVEAACKLLGVVAKGDGHDKQLQSQSDSDLKGAQGQLQTVHNAAAASGQTQLQKHVDKALDEIGLALAIK